MNTDQIEKLLEQSKLDEAKKLITELFKQDWSEEDRGEMFADLAQAYLKIKNQLLENQLENLKKITEALALIDKTEKTADEQKRLDDIRSQLNIKK